MISKVKKMLRKRRFNKMLEVTRPFVDIDNSAILLPSVNFLFHTPRKAIGIVIGRDSIVGCSCIFESQEGKITIGQHSYIGGGKHVDIAK